MYTVAGAQLNGESHRRGTLEPRRLADLVAFRSNPITCPTRSMVLLVSSYRQSQRLRPQDETPSLSERNPGAVPLLVAAATNAAYSWSLKVIWWVLEESLIAPGSLAGLPEFKELFGTKRGDEHTGQLCHGPRLPQFQPVVDTPQRGHPL